jgi:hypothetical protein
MGGSSTGTPTIGAAPGCTNMQFGMAIQGLKFASADPTLARCRAGSENLHKIPEIWFFSSENQMNAANSSN